MNILKIPPSFEAMMIEEGHVKVARNGVFEALHLGELYGGDAETPDVRLGVIRRLLDHLGRNTSRLG